MAKSSTVGEVEVPVFVLEDDVDIPKIEKPRINSKTNLSPEELRAQRIEKNPFYIVVSTMGEGKAKRLTADASTEEALKALRKARTDLREAGELSDRTVRFKPSSLPEVPQDEPFSFVFWTTERIQRKSKNSK